jgi:hypothetical protein
VAAMIRGLPHPFEGKGASGKKFKTEQSEATEADPLLSSNPGGELQKQVLLDRFVLDVHRDRPILPLFLWIVPHQVDNKDMAIDLEHIGLPMSIMRTTKKRQAAAGLSFSPGSATAYTNQQGPPSHSQQQTSDAPISDRQERKAGMYRPNPAQETQQQRGGEHPPLLEIPEEIYAVRKAALQVLKPLTSSWVSPLNQFVSM